MLFNSFPFIFWFLPIVLIGFFALGKHNRNIAIVWLILGAFLFYGYWNPKYVFLLIISILINYFLAYSISIFKIQNNTNKAKIILILAIAINLGILGYYKYANFFLSVIDSSAGTHIYMSHLILPLGISFFSFTQIAFLIDVFQGKAKEYNLLHYFLFVTYFPHLIAGPIIHHAEMMPQFLAVNTYRFTKNNFIVGILIFTAGLLKKVLLADHFASYADSIFSASSAGHSLTFFDAWMGALAYTFQLYFDFSGYSDMAIGLSKMLNIELPINFNSPYKSTNIIDFWRRWHITLSRFLRDYLYIPLGGNRDGQFNRYNNLLITMILGGLWHGAGITFLLWGFLHSVYLIINHLWRSIIQSIGLEKINTIKLYRIFAGVITFFAVVIAWVFFRADSITSAYNIIASMFNSNGFLISFHQYEKFQHITLLTSLIHLPAKNAISFLPNSKIIYYLLIAAAICFCLPNTQQIFAQYKPGLQTYPGDITAKTWLNKVDWLDKLQPILKLRFLGYIWLSYFIMTSAMALFYTTELDARIFQYLPKNGRSNIGTLVTEGDYRSDLFSNSIFHGNAHKIIIVGSSYTMVMDNFSFNINGVPYESVSVGNNGNSLANGFRAAMAILNNYKVDTIIFGVSPIGFGPIHHCTDGAFNNECFGSFQTLGLNTPIVPFEECTPLQPYSKTIQKLLTNDVQQYNQFNDFLIKAIQPLLSSTTPQVTPFTIQLYNNLNHWYEVTKLQAIEHPTPPYDTKNGEDINFHWQSRGALESLAPTGDIYIAFKNLKKIADEKGVKLVVYNSPTTSYADDPAIYPKGFLLAYKSKLANVMKSLGITYFDFGNQMIWDNSYTWDFVHMAPKARERIHAELIYNLFFKGKVQ